MSGKTDQQAVERSLCGSMFVDCQDTFRIHSETMETTIKGPGRHCSAKDLQNLVSLRPEKHRKTIPFTD